MFFEEVSEIVGIAKQLGTGVFVVPDEIPVEIKNAIILEPEEKSVITIEQVREVLGRLMTKQTENLFVVIRPAEKLGEEAANALLKSLEEPGERIHFVLVTAVPSKLLPTILSRAAVYFLRSSKSVEDGIVAGEKELLLAKRLIVARAEDLVGLAEELTKKKDGVRAYVLGILATTIEMLYKSYYKTGKEAFLLKLPKFLKAYENIEKNGHVKLHLVADLM